MHTRRITLATAAFLSVLPASALADVINIPSRVDAVTVFPSGVSVHRVGRARVQTGDHQVVFGALPSNLTDDTIRIGGFGPGATAQSVTVRTGRLAEVTGPDIARVAAEVTLLERERANLAGQQTDLTRTRDALRRANAARPELARAENALVEVGRRLTAAVQRLNERTAALTQARADGERAVKFVTVDVGTVRDGDLDLTIEYMVPGAAAWTPSYAARLDADGGHVGLDMFATVQQTTGEDWRDVRLSVSTVLPASGLALPTFEERFIELEPAPEPEATDELEVRLRMRRPGAGGAGRAMPTADLATAPSSAPMPATERPYVQPPPAPVEQLRGDARPNLLSARLEIPATVTIRSGTSPRRLLAAHSDLESAIEYQAAPRQSNAVFLAARFRNANSFPLLRGQAALFIGSDYVGTAALNDVPIDEEVLLPFGVDAGVTVDRTLANRNLQQRGARDETSLRYDYRVTNHRGRPVAVTVFEQLPVSQSQGLSVRTTPGGRAPESHHEGDPPGVVRWQIRTAPGATDRWSMGFVVSAPRRRAVTGAID